MRSQLASAVRKAVSSALDGIQDAARADLYAFSFYIYDNEDDPRHPALIFGFNTEDQCLDSVNDASSVDEARWNYAFWLQNELAVFGTLDSESGRAVDTWVDSLGLAYSDDGEDEDPDRCYELGSKITAHFVEEACAVAKDLHASGAIVAAVGRPVPIIVHELEYYDEIADQTEAANPPGVAAEFVAWVRGGCP